MNKMKITNKQVKENYKNIISVGYCDLYYLLQGLNARYYNAGVYGWNYDGFEINLNTLIITGYRPIKGNIKTDHKTIEKYENKAREIMKNYELDYRMQLIKVEKLREKFIKELTQKEK